MALPKPKGRQSDVLYFPHSGHIVVLGTAGSGKTTLAILRAAYLASSAPNAGRTLLLTFNKTLQTYLKSIASPELSKVDVHNYHEFARGYLSSRGKLKRSGGILGGDARLDLIARITDEVVKSSGSVSFLKRPTSAVADEFDWIARMGIENSASYEAAKGVGRAIQIPKVQRPRVWQAYEAYRTRRAELGYQYDWEDIALGVLQEFGADGSPRLYRHIVVDEGQDFSPSMLRSLAAAIPADGTLTVFADNAQQIYGGRISWRDAGLNVKGNRVVKFEENYRNTKEVAAFALGITRTSYFAGTSDLVEPKAPAAAGVLPIVLEFESEDDEVTFVVDAATRLSKTRMIGVLLRDRYSFQATYVEKLKKAGAQVDVLHRDAAWRDGPGVRVGTFYSAKGLEFDAVFVPHMGDDRIPYPKVVEMMGDVDEACKDEVKLVYVACTRARAELYLSFSKSLTRVLKGVDATLYRHERRRKK